MRILIELFARCVIFWEDRFAAVRDRVSEIKDRREEERRRLHFFDLLSMDPTKVEADGSLEGMLLAKQIRLAQAAAPPPSKND